ncbi:hypothetical protein LCGC14_1344640 [marine sediment metagenome]|uniref:Uncharacterized protein n=1 Tax=marine sediment metagenome TaxID=412755 RepID=A0A0F9KDC4_9ZZZZ
MNKLNIENKVWIDFQYNCIKETKDDKFIVLNESTFIEILEKTLNKWQIFLEKNTHLWDDIKKIEVNYSDTYDFTKPTIEIELSHGYEILYGYGIEMRIDEFIEGAIEYLKDNPVKLKGWTYPFAKKIENKLKFLKEQIKA